VCGQALLANFQPEGLDLKSTITPSFYTSAIHLSDLDTSVASSGAMITIRASGRYYLSGDLPLNPTNNTVTGIKISASNVILNLNSATIYQQTGNSATGLIGIEVASSLYNIQIFNGKIAGLNNTGLKINSSAHNIRIYDLIISDCSSSTAEVMGVYLDTCNNVTFENCESSNHSNTKAGATDDTGTVNGFKLSSCNNCLLRSCLAIKNSSASQNSYGFRLIASKYNRILDCHAINQITTSATSGELAAGFSAITGTGNFFDNCDAVGNTGGTHAGSIGAGFILGDGTASNEKYTVIINCRASSNDGGTGIGYGVNLTSGTSLCRVVENRANNNTGTASGYGFIDQNTTSTTIYTNNFAYGNGKSDGSVINNYSVAPAPSGTLQIKQGNYNSFVALEASKTGYYNVEIIQ
jgi:hypothetical protein